MVHIYMLKLYQTALQWQIYLQILNKQTALILIGLYTAIINGAITINEKIEK